MSEFKPFMIFLDAVTKAEAFVKNVIEYDKLQFRMEIIESHLSRMLMIFECIYRLPNVTKQQVERVTKITTDLMSLKTTTWISKIIKFEIKSFSVNYIRFLVAMQGNTLGNTQNFQSPSGGINDHLRRKGIHFFDSYSDEK